MSDLIGVPNLFGFVGPVLAGTFRRRDPRIEARLALVNRRARLAIRVWAALTVAFIAFNLGAIVLLAPVLFPSEWSAARVQVHGMAAAFGHGGVAVGLNDLVNLVFIAIAPAGILLILGMMLQRFARAVRKWWPAHRILTTALVVLLAGALFVQGQALVSRLVPQPRAPAVAATAGPKSSSVQSTPPPLPTAAPPSPVVQPPSTQLQPPSTQPATTPVYVVQPGDTLWALAARYLGNPLRYQELFDAEQGDLPGRRAHPGRPQPDLSRNEVAVSCRRDRHSHQQRDLGSSTAGHGFTHRRRWSFDDDRFVALIRWVPLTGASAGSPGHGPVSRRPRPGRRVGVLSHGPQEKASRIAGVESGPELWRQPVRTGSGRGHLPHVATDGDPGALSQAPASLRSGPTVRVCLRKVAHGSLPPQRRVRAEPESLGHHVAWPTCPRDPLATRARRTRRGRRCWGTAT